MNEYYNKITEKLEDTVQMEELGKDYVYYELAGIVHNITPAKADRENVIDTAIRLTEDDLNRSKRTGLYKALELYAVQFKQETKIVFKGRT